MRLDDFFITNASGPKAVAPNAGVYWVSLLDGVPATVPSRKINCRCPKQHRCV
jgi:hypothetical protein